jgi:hypothetical protein
MPIRLQSGQTPDMHTTMRMSVLAMVVVATFAGCAAEPLVAAQHCPAGYGTPARLVTLFFGRSEPGGGVVTDRQWLQFEDQVVVPELPNGFTVLDASGAWLSPAGHATAHEPTKMLLVSLPEAPGALAPVQRIRDAYQARFRQQLVGMSVAAACGDF